MPKKRYIAATVIILLVTAGILAGPIMSRVETPTYHLVDKFDNIEIRHYEPQIVAEVRVSGPREQAIGEGFQLLADYIFGNNITAESVAMTAPVQLQRQQTASQNIAMTAPVQQQSVKALAGDSQEWAVRFVMPNEYNLATLPKANDERVSLLEIPDQTLLSIEFSGTAKPARLEKYQQQLIAFAEQQNLTPVGEPTFAFYNPPWTLPMLRRNEIHLSLLP